MKAYIVKRILSAVPLLLCISFLCFVFINLIPSDPAAMIFITHDLGVISRIADQVLVMNQGVVADRGTFQEIMEQAKDPYTRLLVEKRKAVMKKYRYAMKGMEVKQA